MYFGPKTKWHLLSFCYCTGIEKTGCYRALLPHAALEQLGQLYFLGQLAANFVSFQSQFLSGDSFFSQACSPPMFCGVRM
jgi:hypothetical protein